MLSSLTGFVPWIFKPKLLKSFDRQKFECNFRIWQTVLSDKRTMGGLRVRVVMFSGNREHVWHKYREYWEMLVMLSLLNGQLRHFNNGSASFTPDTLQTHGEHGEQLSFILQMGFISQRRGITENKVWKLPRHYKKMIINAAQIQFICSHITGLMFLFWVLSDGGKIVMDVTLV